MAKLKFFLFLLVSFLFLPFSGFAQPPAGQTAGGIIQQEKQIQKGEKLKERIKEEKKKPKEAAPEEIIPEEEGERVLIKKIIVEGVTRILNADIKKITAEFEGKELSLKDMQKVADLITDEYRKKGYLTSRAYIPPQKIKEGTLTIRVVEGKLGKLEIKGNRYFKTSLLRKKIDLRPEGYFDYSALQKSLVRINEHPDRAAKVVLVPGKEPGTTDVVLQVEDNLPIHIGLEYDNYASRYIGDDRYSLIAEHNNLLGLDDKLLLKFQRSESEFYNLKTGRYVLPLGNSAETGFYFSHSNTKLGKEFEDLDSRGKATICGLFFNQALIEEEDLDLRLNLGFDYKNIKNYLLGSEYSKDRLRIFKTGFDFDITDKWGRTILTSELDVGVPDMFGGMSAKSSTSSREGAGGKFQKGVFNLFRLQPAPFSSYILWKNQAQYCNYNLVASEEFQIGGPTSVRGYPPAEYTGDEGYYTSLEWSFPPYFLPKDLKMPFKKKYNLYDSLHLVLFYDWATTHLNRVFAGEEEQQTLKGCGAGLRFNLGDDFSARVEVGYPLGETPSDQNHAHSWVEITTKF